MSLFGKNKEEEKTQPQNDKELMALQNIARNASGHEYLILHFPDRDDEDSELEYAVRINNLRKKQYAKQMIVVMNRHKHLADMLIKAVSEYLRQPVIK